ncbi:hypothetical protein ACMFMG_007967 [Clarireedia jacksonii]
MSSGPGESSRSTKDPKEPATQTPSGTIQPTPQSADHRNSDASLATERPQPYSMESSRSFQPARSPMLGPSERGRPGQRPKKPPMPRRASSNVQAPHRGGARIGGITSGFGSVRHAPGTVRRRPAATQPALPRLDSSQEDEMVAEAAEAEEPTVGDRTQDDPMAASGEGTLGGDAVRDDDDDDEEDDDEADLSDAESFTLKDRQEAINETHPFGIRIWKPALYKKNRSVQKTAEGDIHSSPGGRVNNWLLFFNLIWTLVFGWWLGLAAFLGAVVCFIFGAAPSAIEYGRVLWGLAGYLVYPFGKFVRLEQDEAYALEDEGEGRTIMEYEQWQSGDIEDGRLFFGPQNNRSIVGDQEEVSTRLVVRQTVFLAAQDQLLGEMILLTLHDPRKEDSLVVASGTQAASSSFCSSTA